MAAETRKLISLARAEHSILKGDHLPDISKGGGGVAPKAFYPLYYFGARQSFQRMIFDFDLSCHRWTTNPMLILAGTNA